MGAAAINEALVPGLLTARNATLRAVASRRPGVAAQEARRWGAPVAHDSYEALLADGEVQAVYIPLANHEHAEWTVRALEAGKHVLCEKPLGLSAEEVQRIADAAERTGRLALEAFMYRFAPRWQRAREILAGGLIGDPRVVRVGFAFKQDPPGYNIRFDPGAGGGIVWDMGCYAVNMARDLLRAEPEAVAATGYTRPGAAVETSVDAILSFPDGRSAVTHVSFDYPNPYAQVEVVGTEGWISMPGTGMRREPFTRLLWHDGPDEVFADGVEPVVESFPFVDPYRLEVEHLGDCVLHGDPPRHGLDDALANVRALAAIFRSLAEGCVAPVG
jgi:predicted dehydrogenase